MSLIKYNINNPSVKDEFITHFDYLLDTLMNKSFPMLTENVNHDFFVKGSFPKVNISRHNDNFVIQAAVAGYKKEDISVQLKNNLLTISGKSPKINPKDSEFYFKEVKLSNFSRTFQLNSFLNSNKMTASVKDGLLTIKIPYNNYYKDGDTKNIEIK